MRDEQFERAVRKLRPRFFAAGSFFYARPVREILCGFYYEVDQYEHRAWKFALPLYDNVRFLHHTFSEQIEWWFASEMRSLDPMERAARFVGCMEPHEEQALAMNTPAAFLPLAEREGTVEYPVGRRGAALTHVMLGNTAAARTHLEILLGDPGIDTLQDYRAELSMISAALERGIDPARALLLEWCAATKRRFELVPRVRQPKVRA